MNTQNDKKYAAPPGAAFCSHNLIFVTASEKASFFVSLIFFILSISISLFIHIFLSPINNIPFRFVDIFFAFLVIIFIITLHEFLHYLTYRVFKFSSKKIKFGFNKKTLSLFCYCKGEIRISIYRLSLIIPLLFSGLFPLIISIIFLNYVYSTAFSLAISICSADAIILVKSFSFSNKSYIFDDPILPGFHVEDRFRITK